MSCCSQIPDAVGEAFKIWAVGAYQLGRIAPAAARLCSGSVLLLQMLSASSATVCFDVAGVLFMLGFANVVALLISVAGLLLLLWFGINARLSELGNLFNAAASWLARS